MMFVNSLRNLLARSAPVVAFRGRDGGDPARFDPALWREIVSAGFGAPQLPEAAGGIGMGYTAAGLMAEETGRTLAATPFLSTALAIELLLAGETFAARDATIASLADGSKLVRLRNRQGRTARSRQGPRHRQSGRRRLDCRWSQVGRHRRCSRRPAHRQRAGGRRGRPAVGRPGRNRRRDEAAGSHRSSQRGRSTSRRSRTGGSAGGGGPARVRSARSPAPWT
ncbi:acyl-CoA dehydrogenase family protein [Sphingomonas sp. MMS24-JH45]